MFKYFYILEIKVIKMTLDELMEAELRNKMPPGKQEYLDKGGCRGIDHIGITVPGKIK